jgi:hypothetical protein
VGADRFLLVLRLLILFAGVCHEPAPQRPLTNAPRPCLRVRAIWPLGDAAEKRPLCLDRSTCPQIL